MASPEKNNLQKSFFQQNRKFIRNSTGLLLVLLIIVLSFSQTPTDWLRGQFKIGNQFDPKISIWKLTNLPKTAPEGATENKLPVIHVEDAAFTNILSIAIEASNTDIIIQQLAFEIDFDDNPEEIATAEGKARSAIEYLGLFTEKGEKLGYAKFTQENNQLIATITDLNLLLRAQDIASLSLRLKPVGELDSPVSIRIQLVPDLTIANSSTGTASIINADLGQNDNSTISDDLLASEVVEVK